LEDLGKALKMVGGEELTSAQSDVKRVFLDKVLKNPSTDTESGRRLLKSKELGCGFHD
jgi:hypothetical protein